MSLEFEWKILTEGLWKANQDSWASQWYEFDSSTKDVKAESPSINIKSMIYFPDSICFARVKVFSWSLIHFSRSRREEGKKVYYGLWLSENSLGAWHDFLNEINQNECRMSQQKVLSVKCFCNIIFEFNWLTKPARYMSTRIFCGRRQKSRTQSKVNKQLIDIQSKHSS